MSTVTSAPHPDEFRHISMHRSLKDLSEGSIAPGNQLGAQKK